MRFKQVLDRLTTIENKNLTEIPSDLQPKNILSQFLKSIRPVTCLDRTISRSHYDLDYDILEIRLYRVVKR